MQGNLFSKPVSMDKAIEIIEHTNKNEEFFSFDLFEI